MAIDYSIFAAEPYDPCAALAVLRPVYMQLRVEGGVKRIKFRDRDTEFSPPDIGDVAALIAQLEADCSAQNGTTRKRFAITAGARGPCGPGGWWGTGGGGCP
jgi:hypothetical protein